MYSVRLLFCIACASEDGAHTNMIGPSRVQVSTRPTALIGFALGLGLQALFTSLAEYRVVADFFSLLEVFECWPAAPVLWWCVNNVISLSVIHRVIPKDAICSIRIWTPFPLFFSANPLLQLPKESLYKSFQPLWPKFNLRDVVSAFLFGQTPRPSLHRNMVS